MLNKKLIFTILLISTACVQESSKIIYKEQFLNNEIKHKLQPNYMKGSYVKNSNNELIRDLRKDDNETENKNLSNTNTKEQIQNTNNLQFVIIEKGDSLLKISREYNLSLKELASTNNIKPPYTVYIGQKIKLLNNNHNIAVKEDKNYIKYKTIVVESGDNLLKISAKCNSSVREIASINNIKPPYNVYVGQKIKVPLKQGMVNKNTVNQESQKKYYIVKQGDNLYSISKITGVTFSELISFNGLKKPYNIYIGQKLNLENKTSYKQIKNKEIQEEEIEKTGKSSISNINNVDNNKTEALFMWPVKGDIIKSFGKQQNGENSDAINIRANIGTKIVAADNGEIAYAGNELKGFGNIVIIKHNNGWLTIYGHCDTINVKVKDKVAKGQTIATIGKTGNVDEPQLYFTVRKGKIAVDPIKYLSNN